MCQAVVYLAHSGQEKENLRDVILLEPVDGAVRLQALFENPVTVQARVGRIDLRHRVTLMAVEEG